MPRLQTIPRKAPRQSRAQATVEAILTATARVLVRDGFDRASTNRIAEEAGVAIGSLYQYFPSKEALVAALVERHMEEMTGLFVDAMGRLANEPLRQAASEVVTTLVEAHAVDPKLHRVLVEQVPRVGRLDRVNEVEDRTAAMVRAWLEAHRDEIRPVDLDAATYVVVTAVEALTHRLVLFRPERVDAKRLIEETTELVVRYLQR